jgi:hypothetical protein
MPFSIRNFFIRIGALLEQIWRTFFQFLSQLFGFLARISGFTNSESFDVEERQPSIGSVQSGQAPNVQPGQTLSSSTQTNPTPRQKTTPRSATRSGGDMDYFRNMARQIKTPQ